MSFLPEDHLRFYIPYISILKDLEHVFFVDDDVIIQKDLTNVLPEVTASLKPTAGLTCPCNVWIWNDECHHFDFMSQHANILETSALYGGRPKCRAKNEKYCLPNNFDYFLKRMLPDNETKAEDQTSWNFGFCLLHTDNWRRLDLTHKYEIVMKENYRLHEVPETSIVFGLGLPFLAFAGAVECWSEDLLKVRDGFGKLLDISGRHKIGKSPEMRYFLMKYFG